MQSMFGAPPFSRFDLGRHAWGNGIGLRQLTLAQGPPAAYALEDILAQIAKIADAETRRQLEMRYQSCKEKDLLTPEGIGCLASLTADLVKAIQTQGKLPIKPLLPPPAPMAFPIIPVAIAVLAAGGLIWFLATRGRK